MRLGGLASAVFSGTTQQRMYAMNGSAAKSNFETFIAALAACLFVAGAMFNSVRAYVVLTSPSGKPCVWNLAALPEHAVKWNLAPGAPVMARESMLKATADWSAATNGVVKFIEAPGGITVEWDATGTRVPDPLYMAWTTFVCNENMDIASSKIVINALNTEWQRNGAGVVTTRKGGRVADLDGTLMHELGHALGLSHSDVQPDVIVGATGNGDSPTMHSVLQPGAETLHLDDQSGIQSLYNVAVAPPSTELNVSASPAKGMAKVEVYFTQTGGDDHTLWDFGDGLTATGASVTHKFSTPGVYTVTAQSNGRVGKYVIEVEKKAKVKKAKKPRS